MLVPIENRSQDPAYNHALEEFVLRAMDPLHDYAMLWQSRPAVVVGRFQNTAEEVNQAYVRGKGVDVVRRLSGGGAVYHDLGNLNFTFVVSQERGKMGDFDHYTLPVLETLRRFGVQAERSARHDLRIDGLKFSGNAQYVSRGRLLHHGTVLFDADLGAVSQVLRVAKGKIESRAVQSVRSKVTNVRPHLRGEVTLAEFSAALMEEIGRQAGGLGPGYRLTEPDQEAVRELVGRRYGTWAWNWGDSPPFTLRAQRRFAEGMIAVRIEARKSVIEDCSIAADFLEPRAAGEIEAALEGVPFDITAVHQALGRVGSCAQFGGAFAEDFLALLFDAQSEVAP